MRAGDTQRSSAILDNRITFCVQRKKTRLVHVYAAGSPANECNMIILVKLIRADGECLGARRR